MVLIDEIMTMLVRSYLLLGVVCVGLGIFILRRSKQILKTFNDDADFLGLLGISKRIRLAVREIMVKSLGGFFFVGGCLALYAFLTKHILPVSGEVILILMTLAMVLLHIIRSLNRLT